MATLGCGAQCIKIALIVFNLIVVLVGLGMTILGSWFLADHGAIRYLGVDDVGAKQAFTAAAVTILIVGICSLLIGVVGCWGACRKKTHCLNCYAILIALVIVLQITCAILAGVFHTKVSSGLLEVMNKTVQHQYGTDKHETDAWDFLQYELSCCGASGPKDWATSFWKQNQTGDAPVPLTCCVLKNSSLSDPQPLDKNKCFKDARHENSTSGDFLHHEGCEKSLEQWVGSHVAIIIGIGVAVIFFEVAIVVLSCILRARINRGYEYV